MFLLTVFYVLAVPELMSRLVMYLDYAVMDTESRYERKKIGPDGSLPFLSYELGDAADVLSTFLKLCIGYF